MCCGAKPYMLSPSTVSQKRSRGRMVYGASHEERIRMKQNKVRFATIFPGAPTNESRHALSIRRRLVRIGHQKAERINPNRKRMAVQ